MVQSRPQVVAHRGASASNAEHTLGAYVAALDEGADALECDVRLTADGHLVCVHDRDLRRTASHEGLVSTTELADLEDLDFAAWKNPWAERRIGTEGIRRNCFTVNSPADIDRCLDLGIEAIITDAPGAAVRYLSRLGL